MIAKKSLSFLAVVTLLPGLFASAPAAAQAWQELGPAPIVNFGYTGRAASLALSANQRNRYYIGGASAGVWESRNGGNSWRPRGDDLPIMAIGAVALDPSDEKVIYAGSGEANYAYHSLYGLGLYKSTNRGRAWTVLAAETFAGRTFSRLAVTPDGAVIWAAVARAGGSFRGFEGARNHPNSRGQVGIFRSEDGGVSWEQIRRGLPRLAASDVDLDPRDSARIYASFGDSFGRGRNGIYRSTDGGQRFRKLSIGIAGNQIGRITLAIAPSDPDRLYALLTTRASRATIGGFTPGGTGTLAILRSDDGGDTWIAFNPGNFQGGQGHYNSAIVVAPNDADTFFVGGVQMLRSSNGGQSYTDVTPPHVDIHDLAFDAADRLVVASDGGIFRSDDLGNSWIDRNNGLGMVQIYAGLSTHPTNPNIMIAGMQDNGTNLRVGGGRDWFLVFGGDGGYTAIDPTDPSRVFVEFQGAGNLYRSTDGGQSFNLSANGISGGDRSCFLPPFVIDPTNPSRMLYATQRIYESTNGGTSWTPISNDLTGGSPAAVRALVQAPSNPNTVYAATNDGRVLVSSNGGTTWDLVLEGIAGWPRVTRQIAVDPDDDTIAYVGVMGFRGNRVLETTDRGRTWRPIDGNLPDIPVNAVAVHRQGGRRFLLIGTDNGVYLSSDGGQRWNPYGTRLPRAVVQDVVVDIPHQRVVISTLGRGVWTTRLPRAGDDRLGTVPLK